MLVPNKSGSLSGLRFAAFGIEFGTTIAVAVVAGYYLDEYLGTAPWVTLLMTLGGMYGALSRLLWSLKKHSKAR
jgi:F0F1-type ATP synthase assembly protein I